MNARTYGMATTGAVVTAGAVAALAGPAGAHNPSIEGLAHVGESRVFHDASWGGLAPHDVGQVCNFNNVHTNRGEFKLVGGSVVEITNYNLVPGNCVSQYLGVITHFRHCDPWGCTDWKSVN
jgi:hypothetical protein